MKFLSKTILITGTFLLSLSWGVAQTDVNKSSSVSKSIISIPPAPDYADPVYWAALPTMKDEADLVPIPALKDNQSSAKADVFYLHPTMFTKGKPKKFWNGSFSNEKLNAKTRRVSVRLQATIFNGAGKIYAPFYRQAHLYSFAALRKKDKEAKKKAEAALDLAYEDVRAAFKYYLENFNNGRPIIVAGHSQGARHGAGHRPAAYHAGPSARQPHC